MAEQGGLFDYPEDIKAMEPDPDIEVHRKEDNYKFSMTAAEVQDAARGILPRRIRRGCWVSAPMLAGDGDLKSPAYQDSLQEHFRRCRLDAAAIDAELEKEDALADTFVLTDLGRAIAAQIAADRPDIVADVRQRAALAGLKMREQEAFFEDVGRP